MNALGAVERISHTIVVARLVQQSLGRYSTLVPRTTLNTPGQGWVDLGSFVPYPNTVGTFKSTSEKYGYTKGSVKPSILLTEVSHDAYDKWLTDTCYGYVVEEVCFV